jgi:hypothetical protein
MLDDIVIDSNIIGHAQNPELGAQFDEATLFLESLVTQGVTLVCFDVGLANNQSRILNEYRAVLGAANLAQSALATLLSRQQFKECPPSVPPAIREIVNRLIRQCKPMDRLFLCVAHNSSCRVLASHDDEDFDDATRERAEAQLGVRVLDAIDCHPLL